MIRNFQESRRHASDLLDFIDASPSPWHAAATLRGRLLAHGFAELREQDGWAVEPLGRYFVMRGDSSIIAFAVGSEPVAEAGFRIVGAHTDSPGLRLKPKAAHLAVGHLRLGVEVYGGPILATFADRDLSLAGRVSVKGPCGIETRLVRLGQPLLRLPNLAIHMNRQVNEDGLKFNRQTELGLLMGRSEVLTMPSDALGRSLAVEAGCEPADLLGFELNVYDTQVGAFWGADGEFIAASRIDNLSSCHAGLCALLAAESGRHTSVLACFDHEEVGSESAVGAGGTFLGDTLQRIVHGQIPDVSAYPRSIARSFLVSADAAHAVHPNFPNAYEPLHAIVVNGGPAIKLNANQRYATDGLSEARFRVICETAGVPCQTYVHRSDLACGSTIGPISAARLGLSTVDCGCPMWAMHSIRESAGAYDAQWFADALRVCLSLDRLP